MSLDESWVAKSGQPNVRRYCYTEFKHNAKQYHALVEPLA
jgi:hypothetical protein